MARNEKHGKRGKRDARWDGKRTGPADDDDAAPTAEDIKKFRPSREEIDRLMDEE